MSLREREKPENIFSNEVLYMNFVRYNDGEMPEHIACVKCLGT